jgi:two-component system, NtrC family, sensor kinase
VKADAPKQEAPDTGDAARPPRSGDDREDLGFDLAEKLRRAQARILGRPHLSIRLRLVGSLVICFALCGAFAIAIAAVTARVRASEQVLESIERIRFRVQRAMEWNAPGQTPTVALADAAGHLDEATAMLRQVKPRLERAGAGDEAAAFEARLVSYGRLLSAMSAAHDRTADAPRRAAIETKLISVEADIERLEGALVTGRRAAVTRMVELSHRALLVFLAALLALFAVITYYFARALVNPIRRFQAYTKRIASGDFTLIAPARRYRDEFSDLALAVNQMLAELQAHQDRCVKAGKLATVGTITSGIAHELNNPLNNISITTEALMADFTTLSEEEKWSLLEDITFETERAAEIVSSLLDFARQEKPELVPLDLAEVIQSTAKLAQNEMAINNISYACDLPAGLQHVRGAANQLRQVFLNLFLNAVQAMPGGGRLNVSVAAHAPDRVCVEVADDGVGIAADVLPRIFDPFFTTKEPGKGTGLGLSVSYSIIRKLGGEIMATSEPGRGTTFHVCLPVADAP